MSRALAESAHGLTLNEARVMMLAIRRVDPLKAAELQAVGGYVQVRVTASEFAELGDFSARADGGTPVAAYEGLKAACERLYERSATWKEGKRVTRMRWVWKAQYCEGEGWAEVCFAPDLTPHLFALNERFVRYRLEYARGLRSIYATNLLRLLMTQRDTGFKVITLEDFRHVMEVPETYRYADIKKHVLAPAIAELNKKADLSVQFQETKKGRSVAVLQFRFKFLKAAAGTRQSRVTCPASAVCAD